MKANEADQPLLIFHDAESKLARAAPLPADFKHDAKSISFNGRSFRYVGSGIVFWDYLVTNDEAIVGIVFNKFDIDAALKNSALLNASTNVDSDEYGYYLRLRESAQSAEVDGAQAFGSDLFESDGECLLYLLDWHRRGYDFDLSTEQTISAN